MVSARASWYAFSEAGYSMIFQQSKLCFVCAFHVERFPGCDVRSAPRASMSHDMKKSSFHAEARCFGVTRHTKQTIVALINTNKVTHKSKAGYQHICKDPNLFLLRAIINACVKCTRGSKNNCELEKHTNTLLCHWTRVLLRHAMFYPHAHLADYLAQQQQLKKIVVLTVLRFCNPGRGMGCAMSFL
jgi:hypothetical protein